MSKPHICFIGLGNLPALAAEYGHLRIGGAQVQQTLLAKALVKRSYKVSMVVFDHGQPDGSTWHGVKTYRAYAPEAGIPGVRFLHPRLSGLCAAIRRADPDICYMSCASAEVGQVVLTQSRRRKTIFWAASDADCDPNRLLIKYRRDKLLYAYGLRRVDAIIAQSAWQQAALERNFGVRSIVAGSFVETPADLLGFFERDTQVLWVSNLYPLKRPGLVLDLATRTPQISYQMIGGPMPAYTALFERLRARTEACRNVCFRGHVPYHDVPDAFRRSRVLINTSEIEGFPNTYLQAWAHGTPVIAFFDPDGVIARERLGRAVHTADEMAAAIAEFTSDAALWRETSDRCLAYMAKEYGEDRTIAPYVEVIEELGRQGRRRGD